MAEKGRRRGGKEKRRDKSSLDPRYKLSSVSKVPFDLRGVERWGERGEKARISFHIADTPRPAAPGRVGICSARNLHGGHSGFLLCRSKGERKHSFLPEGILVQAQREKEKRGREGNVGAQHHVRAQQRRR